MKIIAMVNGGFAIPSMRALKESRHELAAVIAMPVRTRGGKAEPPPIRRAAEDFLSDVPLYDPEDINSSEGVEFVRSLNADLIFICDYGRILSKEVLELTRFGGVNLHGSLLPKYRGAAPINRAIQAGEKELGVSVIFIEPRVDAGPVVGVASYVPSIDDDAVAIENHLAELGAPLVLKAVDEIEDGTIKQLPQSDEHATKAPKLRKEEGRIDWTQNSEVIINQYRAFQPWPRTYSSWHKSDGQDKEPLRLILGPFQPVSDDEYQQLSADACKSDPGTVLCAEGSELWIRTGSGAVKVLSAQPAGKKNMPVAAFLRGYPVRIGDKMA